ncbi:MAG: argininosuccinate lyase [Flavobacteriaceae bacterium]|nr:argininosuccinate lyase [Flavobacteriaceae bacterium]
MKLWQKGVVSHQKIDSFTVGNDREYDLFLAKYDVLASIAHAQMLGQVGLLTSKEVELLVSELNVINKQIVDGSFFIEKEFEDVHSKIEFHLTQQLGEVGKKIHTARSRNDQILVAMHLYLKEEINSIKEATKKLFDSLLVLAHQHKNVLLPGYTHLQIAMPSSFGLWFSAYAESLIDDTVLLNAAQYMTDQNPLGSAAGYGSSFPIDRESTTKALGFSTLKYNVVAAQMGRGKLEKAVATGMAGIAGTLSRFSMDICLYMSQNFDFISFPEELTTGSSIMPHKKNPDVFELIRGKCNALQGLPNQLTLMANNLPSGYHREMQLFKGPIIEGIEELKACLEMMTFSIEQVIVKEGITLDEKYDYLFSVDTLNELVNQRVPFRDAYKQVGETIEKGDFIPQRKLNHTHQGSIGNLCLDEIQEKMNRIL